MKNIANNFFLIKVLFLCLFGIQWVYGGGNIMVNSTLDQSVPGQMTLREAVAIANANTDVVITFDETLFLSPQTIVLQNGEILITSAMTINGLGADLLTIDGGGNSRLIFIDDGTSDDLLVNISGISLTRGNGVSELDSRGGGCVFSREHLVLDQVIVTDCQAAGAGGGVATQSGILHVIDSSISFNQAGNQGGGINVSGSDFLMTRSTINNNSTFNGNTHGGGININQAPSVNISNSTIAHNQSRSDRASGVFLKSATLLMNNATVFNNSGAGVGINNSEAVNISNSIIAENEVNDCDFANTNSNSANLNNLDTDGSCDVSAANHMTVENVLLVPLSNQGGSTLTLIPHVGSPVIDAGDNETCETIDQRGVPRPRDGNQDSTPVCDIGAVEGVINEFIFKNSFETVD